MAIRDSWHRALVYFGLAEGFNARARAGNFTLEGLADTVARIHRAGARAYLTLNTLTFLIAPLVDDPSQAYTPQPALGLACLLGGAAVAWPLLQALRRSVDSPRSAA